MNIPNWQHHSNKPKTTKGQCKGKIKARRQSLNHLKAKYLPSKTHSY